MQVAAPLEQNCITHIQRLLLSSFGEKDFYRFAFNLLLLTGNFPL